MTGATGAGKTAITYLGWSGFRIDRDHGAPIYLDPPMGTEIPAGQRVMILLSHGHPEHIGGARAYLQKAGAKAAAMIIASSSICRHLESEATGDVRFRPVRPGDRLQPDARLNVAVFRWTHLPLLPPGLGASVRHVRQLLSRPGLALRIAKAGLLGPRAGPMLGFRLAYGPFEVLAYGEGLHRFCKPEAPTDSPAHVITLAAIEPGDEAAMPALVRACGTTTALLFEPHTKWRDAFGMERVDLPAVNADIGASGIAGRIAVPLQPEHFG